MSSSITIPRRRRKTKSDMHHRNSSSSLSASAASGSSVGSSPSFSRYGSPMNNLNGGQRSLIISGGGPASSTSSEALSLSGTGSNSEIPSSSPASRWERRPSLLSASLSRTEHIVINVGDSDAPRLISCVKSSQGFDWNQDIFLPSYADYDSSDLECKQDPIQDIVLTDEEIANMFPR